MLHLHLFHNHELECNFDNSAYVNIAVNSVRTGYRLSNRLNQPHVCVSVCDGSFELDCVDFSLFVPWEMAPTLSSHQSIHLKYTKMHNMDGRTAGRSVGRSIGRMCTLRDTQVKMSAVIFISFHHPISDLESRSAAS